MTRGGQPLVAHEPVNILLVDDQPAKLLSYQVILRELGENLIQANSASEALQILLKTDVALILADVSMPELDGFDFAKMLRGHPRFEKTAIIFVSAIHLSDLDRLRGYATGALDYVSVPVVPELLRAKVKVFVDLYRKTRQLEQLNLELERRVGERTAALEASNERLQDSEERLRLASEAAGFGTYDYDVAADSMHCSPYLRALLGISGAGPLDLESFLACLHPDDRGGVRRAMCAPDDAGWSRHETEFRVPRSDASMSWMLDRGRSFALDGEAPGWRRVMGTILDITDRKRVEERQQLLMDELDHRVKNILANVAAVARLSSMRAASVGGFVKALDGRLQAMSRAHALLRRGNWSGVGMGELIHEALGPFGLGSKGPIIAEGEPVHLNADQARSLALVFHELVTNAIKHGALSAGGGQVRLAWSSANDALVIDWSEAGGPRVEEPAARGFGLTILQQVTSESGDGPLIEFLPEGLRCAFSIPHDGRQGQGRDAAEQARLATSRPSRLAASYGMARARRTFSILVVEDEPLLALNTKADLESDGHVVIGPARNFAQGMALVRDAGVDLALLDVSLLDAARGPDTGAPIAQFLLERNIPVAFVTGYAGGAAVPEQFSHVPRLNKPYDIADLRALIARLTRPAAEQHVAEA